MLNYSKDIIVRKTLFELNTPNKGYFISESIIQLKKDYIKNEDFEMIRDCENETETVLDEQATDETLNENENENENVTEETVKTKKKPIYTGFAKDSKEFVTAIIVMTVFILNSIYMIVKWVMHTRLS